MSDDILTVRELIADLLTLNPEGRLTIRDGHDGTWLGISMVSTNPDDEGDYWFDTTPLPVTEEEEGADDYEPDPPTSGTYCRMLPGLRVEHYMCDEHADGTITSVSDDDTNGTILTPPLPDALKGFDR